MKKFCVFFLICCFNVGASVESETYRLLNILSDSFRYIREESAKQTSDKDLIEAAIQGMLSSLDPYSEYINQERYQDLLKDIHGAYAGPGMEFTLNRDRVTIVAPLDQSPALRAGLRSGDVILKINNESVQGFSLFEISDRLRGQVGEPLSLTIQRGDKKPFVVHLKREKIVLNPVSWKTIKSVGYIRLGNFNHAQTAKLFKNALRKIEKKLQKNLKGIIIDVRNNPGGILEQAVLIADFLLSDVRGKTEGQGADADKQNIIVSIKTRHKENDRIYRVSQTEKLLGKIPIVLLINGGTASAAEILSAALKDHDRAFLLGTKTYGKGSIQTILPIPPGYTAIRLTTGYYYSPKGIEIQGKGVEPHEVLKDELSEDAVLNEALYMLGFLEKKQSVNKAFGPTKRHARVDLTRRRTVRPKSSSYDAFHD